jgi:hypothetical protein
VRCLQILLHLSELQVGEREMKVVHFKVNIEILLALSRSPKMLELIMWYVHYFATFRVGGSPRAEFLLERNAKRKRGASRQVSNYWKKEE